MTLRAPRCGEQFCDACGDCLYCYADDRCHYTADGHHVPGERQRAPEGAMDAAGEPVPTSHRTRHAAPRD